MYCKFCKSTDANLDYCTQGLQARRGLPGEIGALAPSMNFPQGRPILARVEDGDISGFSAYMESEANILFLWHTYHTIHGGLWPLERESGQGAHQSCLSSSIFSCSGLVLTKLLGLLSPYTIQPCPHISYAHTHAPMHIEVCPRDMYRHTTMYTHHSEAHTLHV